MIPDEVEKQHEQVYWDELYDEAAQLVIEYVNCIDLTNPKTLYNGVFQVAGSIDQLELGILVGPHEGSRSCQLLVVKNAVDIDYI